MESMLETLENLITVHFSTSESSPTDKVSTGKISYITLLKETKNGVKRWGTLA